MNTQQKILIYYKASGHATMVTILHCLPSSNESVHCRLLCTNLLCNSTITFIKLGPNILMRCTQVP